MFPLGLTKTRAESLKRYQVKEATKEVGWDDGKAKQKWLGPKLEHPPPDPSDVHGLSRWRWHGDALQKDEASQTLPESRGLTLLIPHPPSDCLEINGTH